MNSTGRAVFLRGLLDTPTRAIRSGDSSALAKSKSDILYVYEKGDGEENDAIARYSDQPYGSVAQGPKFARATALHGFGPTPERRAHRTCCSTPHRSVELRDHPACTERNAQTLAQSSGAETPLLPAAEESRWSWRNPRVTQRGA